MNLTPDLAAYEGLRQRLAANPGVELRHDKPIWLFGAGNFARDVHTALKAAGYDIIGFIESQPKQGTSLGLPVHSWDTLEVGPEDQVVIAIHNRTAPLDQLATQARAHGFTTIAYPWDIHRLFAESLGWRFWLSGPAPLLAGLDRLKAVHLRLADDESRQCLYRIVAFRLGLDESFGSFRHDLTQYFNPLTLSNLPDHPLCYVDGGAFDGDSFLQLTAMQPVGQAYLFEPDPGNYRKLTHRLQSAPGTIHCLPLGLTDSYRILSFAGGQGEGGTLTSTGDIHVACASLDDLAPNMPVDFIKLDVEGAEIQALQGARQLIKKHRPRLAISLYHRPDDLWAIPALLDDICPGYRLFIRQHYFNSFESVLYAVPDDSQQGPRP